MGSIQLSETLIEDARRRAESEGVTVTELVTDVLRRAFERAPDEESILVYDHSEGGAFQAEREPGESEESYSRRTALYRELLGRG